MCTFEGELSEDHVEGEYSQCPDVDTLIVIYLFEDLRSHVTCSSTKCIHLFVCLISSTKAQVTYLGQVVELLVGRRLRTDLFQLWAYLFLLFRPNLRSQQNILRLDVPV